MEVLSQIEGAESYLRSLGLRQLRVRHHGPVARLEVDPADFPRLVESRLESWPCCAGWASPTSRSTWPAFGRAA